jgi:hypothetical protein
MSGAELIVVASENKITAKTIAGRKTAAMAFPTPPAFLPPTSPAINGPIKGSQNKRSEIKNIQKIALPTLPAFLTIESSFPE